MTKRWIIAPPDPSAASLAEALGLPVSVAQVLTNRGIRDAASARSFLDPRLQQLADPFELPDMALAVDRILAAGCTGYFEKPIDRDEVLSRIRQILGERA